MNADQEKILMSVAADTALIKQAVLGNEQLKQPGLISDMISVKKDVEKVKKFNWKLTTITTAIVSGLTFVFSWFGDLFSWFGHK